MKTMPLPSRPPSRRRGAKRCSRRGMPLRRNRAAPARAVAPDFFEKTHDEAAELLGRLEVFDLIGSEPARELGLAARVEPGREVVAPGVIEQALGGRGAEASMNSSMVRATETTSSGAVPEAEGAETEPVAQEGGQFVLERLRVFVGEGRTHGRRALAHVLFARLDHHGQVRDPRLGQPEEIESGVFVEGSVAGEAEVRDHREDIGLVSLEDCQGLFVARREQHLGTGARALKFVRLDAGLLLDEGLGLPLDDLVEQRQIAGVVADRVFYEEDDADEARARVRIDVV